MPTQIWQSATVIRSTLSYANFVSVVSPTTLWCSSTWRQRQCGLSVAVIRRLMSGLSLFGAVISEVTNATRGLQSVDNRRYSCILNVYLGRKVSTPEYLVELNNRTMFVSKKMASRSIGPYKGVIDVWNIGIFGK